MTLVYENKGITGKVSSELSPYAAYRFGKAYGMYLKSGKSNPKVLVAKDTRASGDMISSAIWAGLCSEGVNVVSIGIVPIPALSYLIRKYKMDGGVMVCAPKRIAEYTGICFLDRDGNWLNADAVDYINKALGEVVDECGADYKSVGRITRTHTGLRDYVDYIKSTVDCRFRGIKLAIDCANGSTFECAKIIFKELGADVEMIHNVPDGFNINDKCGFGDTSSLREFVPSHKCDFGIAFDGVGFDFCVVDENGNIISQNKIDAFCGIECDEHKSMCTDAVLNACSVVRAYCMNDKKMSEFNFD